MTRGADRKSVFRRQLVILIPIGLIAVVVCFMMGWVVANYQASGRNEKSEVRPPEAAVPPAPVGRAAGGMQLERAVELLTQALSASLLPAGGVETRREIVRDGTGSWVRIHLGGQYKNLEPFFAAGLAGLRAELARRYDLDCLAAIDPVSGICTVLLLSGHRVVLIGEFSSLTPPPETVALGREPKIAIIIDDMGRSLQAARRLADLELPLTFAVFPHLPHSRRVAELLSRCHRDIILHLPMEPRNWPRLDPGPGALYSRMDEAEFQRVLAGDLRAVPGIIGVNNHMGSRLTEDRAKMKLVMRSLAGTGLFFIDSRTISDTVAWKEAEAAGIPVLQRDVFLDNRPEEKAILEQFRILVAVARSRGYAVGIGHPYPATIAALARIPPLAEAAGVELVPVRELVAAHDGRAAAGFPESVMMAGGLTGNLPGNWPDSLQ